MVLVVVGRFVLAGGKATSVGLLGDSLWNP